VGAALLALRDVGVEFDGGFLDTMEASFEVLREASE
jgi:hypothetical protein